MLTPPVPCVKTVSPGFNLFPSIPYNPFQAVTAAHGSVLPCLKSKVVGILTKPDSSNAPYCLRVPSIPPPSPLLRSARCMGPAMWVWLKSVRTRSPFWKRVTRGPVATTVPAPSEAGMMGRSIGKPYLPYRRRMSQRWRGGIWVTLE